MCVILKRGDCSNVSNNNKFLFLYKDVDLFCIPSPSNHLIKAPLLIFSRHSYIACVYAYVL